MDELKELSTFAGYSEYKAAFDAEVRRTELGFVRIGYMLRMAEDTDILRDSGYANMEEFAEVEYRIDKSQASRFTNINRRFSVDGYSDRLQERFEGYGVAKLGELLTLSDEVIETLPADLSRTEIQAVKREIKEEQQISDLEVMMEGHNASQEAMTDNLDRFMHQYIHDNPMALNGLCKAAQAPDNQQIDHIMDTLAPSGLAVQMARIQGIGKLMLSIKGKDLPMELLNVRTNEKETCPWDRVKTVISGLIHSTDPEASWKALYAEEYPPAEEEREAQRRKEAEEQRKAEEKEKERIRQAEERRERKEAEKAKQAEEAKKTVEKPKVAPVQQKAENRPESPVITGMNEHSKPRQMEIEEYPEYLPENYIKCHDGTEVTEHPGEAIWLRICEQIDNLLAASGNGLDGLGPQDIIDMHRITQTIEEELERLMNL